MHTELELYDLTIIGGGPAGLYAAFYSGMRDMKTKLIEAKQELGGKLQIYPEKMIWDVGGVTPVRCERLIRSLIEQANTFEPTLVFGQQIAGMARQPDGTMLLTSTTGERHLTRSVLLTTGYGVAHPNKLELEGAERFEATNLYYGVHSLDVFRGKRILLSGGSDTSVDWATELESIAESVTLVHRRKRIGGHEKNVRLLMKSSVRVMHPYRIEHVYGDDAIEAVTLAHLDEEGNPTGHTEVIEVDAVVVNHGHSGDLNDFKEWGIVFDNYSIPVGRRMSTTLPGVFAAGDMVSFDNKLHLIAGTFTDAAVAVNGAKLYLEPEAQSMAYVSSHNGIFNERNKTLARESLV